MNKRIKDLQKIAHQEALKRSKVAPDICTEYSEYFAGMKQEIFADLIVQECASVAAWFSIENKRIHPDIDPRDMTEANHMVYHCTCQSVCEEIKEHFGVK